MHNIILVVTVMAPWFIGIGLVFGVVALLERKRQ
jgi:hypothetical protein